MKVAMVYIDHLRGLKYAVCRQTVIEKTVLEHFFPSVTTISLLQLNHRTLELTDALKFKLIGHLDPPSRSKKRSVLLNMFICLMLSLFEVCLPCTEEHL